MIFFTVTFNTNEPDFPKCPMVVDKALLGESDRHSVYEFQVRDRGEDSFATALQTHPQVLMFSRNGARFGPRPV